MENNLYWSMISIVSFSFQWQNTFWGPQSVQSLTPKFQLLVRDLCLPVSCLSKMLISVENVGIPSIEGKRNFYTFVFLPFTRIAALRMSPFLSLPLWMLLTCWSRSDVITWLWIAVSWLPVCSDCRLHWLLSLLIAERWWIYWILNFKFLMN